ncbi:unnamed protein product, partial [Rotaria sp. Silwood2]
MEDRFQFEDFDNPQLLATNNRDQEITIVAANDKIKRTKNEQQVIKETISPMADIIASRSIQSSQLINVN